MIDIVSADRGNFAVCHAIYADSNRFCSFDWNERTEDLSSDRDGYFICRDERLIGGFALSGNKLSDPFMAAPFCDRKDFWNASLQYAAQVSGQREITLVQIPECDAHELAQSFGAVLQWSQRRMLRPTDRCRPALASGFHFDRLAAKDMPEIIQAVYQAHSAGHTSTVWEPDMAEIQRAIDRRFHAFSQTNTLYMGNIVRRDENREIAGVCVAGIYPDSPNNFATIHQVSVSPEYRRKGIAKAMMLKSIHDAHPTSPVITLGVLIGNPAEILYRDIGFKPGPGYSELIWPG